MCAILIPVISAIAIQEVPAPNLMDDQRYFPLLNYPEIYSFRGKDSFQSSFHKRQVGDMYIGDGIRLNNEKSHAFDMLEEVECRYERRENKEGDNCKEGGLTCRRKCKLKNVEPLCTTKLQVEMNNKH